MGSSKRVERAKGRVLLLAYAYPPENLAGAARPYRFAKYLPECGYDVSVLTASEQNGAAPDYVHHLPAPHRSYEKFLRKFFLPGDWGLPWVRPATAAGKALIERNGITAVLSTSPPHWIHLAAMRLQRHCGVKWIADFRDPARGAPGRLRAFPYVDRVLEPLVVARADHVIVNTDAVLERWKTLYPAQARKISVIWNGFDSEEDVAVRPIPPRAYRLLMHTGLIHEIRQPGPLLASVARLVARGLIEPGSLKLQQIGMATETLGDTAARDRLSSLGMLELTPMLPAAETARRAAEANYLLLLDVTVGSVGLQVPSKIFNYIRIGRPILALTTRNSPVERILERCGVPFRCIYPDLGAEEMDGRVLDFLKLPSEPVEASSWFWETFDGREQTKTLAGTLDGL